jgi:hypothetical protein
MTRSFVTPTVLYEIREEVREMKKRSYIAPQLMVHGSVEKITLKPGVGNANPNPKATNPGEACGTGNASFCS